MPYIIKSTFNITSQNGENRAFIDNNDINPKTGKLGIRLYKKEAGCFHQLILEIKKLFGRIISVVDGSGNELILSKKSFQNWFHFHGKEIPSKGFEIAKVIDEIFDQMIKENKGNQAPHANRQTKSLLSYPKEEGKSKSTSLNDLEKKQLLGGFISPERLENLKTIFKEKAPERSQELEERLTENSANIERQVNAIAKIKEDVRADLERLKKIEITPDTASSSLPDLSFAEYYNPLRTGPLEMAIFHATEKYRGQEEKEAIEKRIHKIETVDPEELPNLNLLHRLPIRSVPHEEAKARLEKEDPELFSLVKEAKALFSILYKRACYIRDGVPLSTHLENLRNPLLTKYVKDDAFDQISDFIMGFQQFDNKEVRDFLIQSLTENPENPLTNKYAELLAAMWDNSPSTSDKKYLEGFDQKIQKLIKQFRKTSL